MSFVPVDKSSIIIEATTDISVGVKGDEVSIHSSLQTNGYEVENHPVESGSHLEPVLRGEPKTGLHREPANQVNTNVACAELPFTLDKEFFDAVVSPKPTLLFLFQFCRVSWYL